MKRLVGLMALAALLSFGTGTLVYAGEPIPAPNPGPTDGTKKPDAPKLFADDKKDEQKDKGGK